MLAHRSRDQEVSGQGGIPVMACLLNHPAAEGQRVGEKRKGTELFQEGSLIISH